MRKRCLLIIDVQTALTSQYPVDENKMIEHIRKLIRVCHNQHLEIVYVRHHDEELILNSDGWQIDSRITPRQDDKIFEKEYNSAFKNTNLDAYLKSQGIQDLIIVGMQSEYCIDTSIKVAFELGYRVIVPKDATTTFDNDIISGKVLKQYLEEKIWKNRFAQVIEVDTLLMMIESKLGFKFSYGKTSFKDAALIRQAVFVEEQGFEKEFDKLDNTAYHLVIYKDEQPIAVGRMYFKDKTTMILGRIAAIKEYRGQKLGSKVVTALENKARELGCLETELSAQQQAQKFYEKLGYKPDGDMYYDEWCPHVTMKKIL